MDTHERYMQRAIELGWRGIGRNSPNPMVGCVIVRDGEIAGEGSHFYPDVEHAETIAIRQAGEKVKGATLYVSLEPCCHTGRTSPCSDAIIKSSVSKVVYGIQDPDPRVNGAGHKAIADSGIEIIGGILGGEIREQNKFFITAKEKKRPYILLKWAMTLDGKIATRTGKSMWISNKKSRNAAHHLRNIYDAVLIGHSTVITDNPKLTCRVDRTIPLSGEIFSATPSDIRNPVRVIIDTFGATLASDCDIYKQPGK
ncbi:MAG: bifunctional diaminohydroxyphosphoribosylaminopyrimidine deaminase/5-amino-6-(5-phosphoribosylamino)uracil reductase RibD, partial [bacterium]|nr:bifunctional diaminohydroxyphosphoribosylaminopyrimidine deaminase/5-amino-6-(5-phosphoribosylamino)uracil reductase RibD [bacterium]